VHPYILLNYLGQYNDVSTLAHELGHTMHSYYSNKTQPFPLADYPTFVAEVASTFNEALLIDYMLKQIKDEPTRLSLLGNHLENIKATVFRQTQFAEFEMRMHEMGLKGQPITGDALAKLYLDITKRYYGHDQRVVIVDDYVAQEWSYIPHFYRDFYVFQYATSFTAAEALAALYFDITRQYYGHDRGVLVVDDYVANEWSYIPHFYSDFYVFQYATSFTAAETLAARVLAGDRDTTARYLTFIGSGGSTYAIELLREAGVDMTTDEPLEVTMRTMNRLMDEIEAILARR